MVFFPHVKMNFVLILHLATWNRGNTIIKIQGKNHTFSIKEIYFLETIKKMATSQYVLTRRGKQQGLAIPQCDTQS